MQKKPTYLRWLVAFTMMAFIWLGSAQANAMGDGTKSATTPDNASEIAPPAQRGATAITPQGRLELGVNRLPSSLLYDNGPLVNSPGTGAAGADESVLQSTSLGMNILGFGFQYLTGNHMADDFEVTGNWTIDQFTFYAYQTGSSTTSTITGGYLQIFDGDPSAGGTLIWGDMVTNRMTSTSFTNIYRVTETTLGASNRPIMEVVCATPGLVLTAGTYWVEYTVDGSLASGPWAPPVTINGQTVTGNALQYLAYIPGWGAALDSGTGTGQDLPFLIEGISGTPGLNFVSPALSMGFRPIGAWMEPARYEVVNIPGGGAASIATADIDNTYDGFVEVVAPALPFILDEGETTTEFGLTASDAVVAPGAFNGTFALIYGSARAMITANYDGTAYVPIPGDVWENPLLMTPVTQPAGSAVPQPESRELFGFYKNYILPNDVGAGPQEFDAVWKITVPTDQLFDFYVTVGSANFAIYAEDFNGEGGPMAGNALIQAMDAIIDFPMYAGTYYIVGSALANWGGAYVTDPMPLPDVVTYNAPADGAININNGMMLDWTFGANVFEYQLILGTTYPPATVVVDWTSDLAESYTLTNLNPNLQYFWQVNVRNTQGTTFGPVWGFTTSIDVPTGLTASIVDPGPTNPTVTVNLSWNGQANRAFLGYNVYRNGVKINPALVTGATYADLGLARNTTYTYNVTAVFDEGESALSLPAVVTTQGVGIVNGMVTDALATTAIAGASVVISGPAGTYNLTTAANGTYSAQVYAGTYSYTVSAPGYINGTATGVVVAHAATVTTNFALLETPFPVDYVIATELNDENVLLQWGFDLSKGAGNRSLVEFQVWREKVYLPGAFEQIGTTSQTQFVDFDWGLQDWGVYKWYIVAVYTANQSAPVGSNTLDKDMNTMVDVTVVLNSNDSPAGTMVSFQNISEPLLDLTYSTTLGATGTFEWDAFRRGTYDIEVMKAGYAPVYESSVDIFDVSSFEWLLIELLAAPENLYVTPTGLATWDAGSVTAPLRSFQNYKVFLDGVLVAEVANPMYQYGTNGEALVDGETYLAEVAAVYSTGQSAKTGYTWTYIACDNYATPGSFNAVQVEGTVDVSLTWTVPTIPPADDQIDFARLYRDGEVIAELTGVSYLDEDLDFATYTYCITFVYESGAETCPATICETVEVIGGGFVNGNVKEAAYLGGSNIEGAEVMLTNTADNTITFTFTTNAAGNYTGEVLAGTYDYEVSAAGYVSATLEDVVIAQTATVTRDFVLNEYPFPVSNVVAVDQETSALIYWNTPGTGTGGSNTVYEEFDNGMPAMLVTDAPAANWTVANDFLNLNTPGAGVWRSAYYNAEFGDFVYEVEMQRTAGSTTGSMGIYVRGTGFMNPTAGSGEYANVFTITQGGSYWYATMQNGDLMGDWTGWLTSSAINTTGPNVISAVASGSSVQFMVNGILVHTVNNTTLTGGYCGVFAHEGTAAATTVWDYMMIEPGAVVRDFSTNHVARETKGNLQEVFLTYENTVEPVGLKLHKPVTGSSRELMGYNVWRNSCDETAGLTFLGYTLDSTFVDNQFGALEAGVYKWAVEAVYTENNAVPQYSNCLDKDMITQVSVTVTTNSLDSPVETAVMFTNTSEPDLGLVYEVELDETGYYAWDEFRKGTYDIYVEKYGFAPISLTGYVIDGPEAFEFVLEELLMPVADLYVTPTAYATWRQGGIIPFEPFMEDFNAGLPDTWTIVDGGSTNDTWYNTTGYDGNSVDGTPFMFANSDAAGIGSTMDEQMISPVINGENAAELYLMFDYVYQYIGSEHFSVDVFDGTDWVEVFYKAADTGPFPWGPTASEVIDVTEQANADFQVRFNYVSNGWNWYVAVDNVVVTDNMDRYANRALQYYKVWLDGIFVTDTENTFHQYNTETLVPGQEYFSEVAAVYTNGMSAKMNYTWTYIPCDSFPAPSNLIGEVLDFTDVLLSWGGTAPPPGPTEIVVEPFEAYNAGDNLAQQAQGLGIDYWTTWSGAVGGPEDPMVSTAQAHAGTKSIVIEGTNDAVLLLEDYTEGVFNVDFYVYIPTGKVGYFNLLQDFAGSTSQWGMQAYFGLGGGGTVDAGAESAAAFTYTYDTWHHVSVKIDLDNDFAVMKLNDTELVSWVWSSGSFGTGTLNKFDAANFYAWAETGTPGAFFDDITVTMEPVTTAKALTFEPGEPLGANVYRDGMLIAELVTDTLYLDEAVAPGVYNYCVTYIYEGGAESCMNASCIEVSVLEDCVPPTDLTAVLAPDPATAILTWNTFAGVWMHYGDLVYADAIGLTDFSPFTVAIQWDPADLADYDGRAFSKIRLYYGTGSIGDVMVQVWEGTTLVMEEAVTTTIVGESWNEIEFTEPVVIDATKSYRIGYTTSNYDGYPAGAQNYANDLNSDLVLLDGVWDNLSNYLPYSWMIETFIGQAPAGAFNAPVESTIISKATSANLVSSPVAVNTNRSDVGRSADRAFLGYNVYREGTQVNSELVLENTYQDTPGAPGNYCYTVTAVYSVCGESDPSNEACIDILVGVNDPDLANNRIYPNPSNSIVNIELSSNISQVVVYNYVGQVVFEQNVTKSEIIQLNVRNYEAGAYLVKFLTNTGESFTKKVVVTH